MTSYRTFKEKEPLYKEWWA